MWVGGGQSGVVPGPPPPLTACAGVTCRNASPGFGIRYECTCTGLLGWYHVTYYLSCVCHVLLALSEEVACGGRIRNVYATTALYGTAVWSSASTAQAVANHLLSLTANPPGLAPVAELVPPGGAGAETSASVLPFGSPKTPKTLPAWRMPGVTYISPQSTNLSVLQPLSIG